MIEKIQEMEKYSDLLEAVSLLLLIPSVKEMILWGIFGIKF